MHHGQRRGRQHLDHEVPVRDGIERVGGHAIEAQLGRRGLPIERVAGPGERPGAQRRDVEPGAGIGDAPAIALQHLDVREQVVGEQDGLGGLHVCRAGQDGVPLALGEVNERPLEADDPGVEPVARPARPEADVRGDLVVARPARVQLPAHSCPPAR